MAVHLRKKRFDGGALRLDQVKLSFALDSETGLPCGYSVYQQKESNRYGQIGPRGHVLFLSRSSVKSNMSTKCL